MSCATRVQRTPSLTVKNSDEVMNLVENDLRLEFFRNRDFISTIDCKTLMRIRRMPHYIGERIDVRRGEASRYR